MARRGGDKKYHKDKENKKDSKRKIAIKKTKAKLIIACEDSVSAPTYFQEIIENLKLNKKITQSSIVIVPHNKHTDPMGVLNNLKNYNKDGIKYSDFDEKWIVIDRDINYKGGGHSPENFNNVFINTKKSKINIAYANDSFELWYLLHFTYRNTPIMRDEIIKEVIKYLKRENKHIFRDLSEDNFKTEKYQKLIFQILEELQSKAIENAKRLLENYNYLYNPEKENPSTNIHKLIEIFLELEND